MFGMGGLGRIRIFEEEAGDEGSLPDRITNIGKEILMDDLLLKAGKTSSISFPQLDDVF